MTTQEKLKELTEKIRKDIPRLSELSAGCLVLVKNSLKGTIVMADKPTYYIVCIESYMGNLVVAEEDITVLGQEPMLNDVLEWLQLLNGSEDIDLLFEQKGFMQISRANALVECDLSKPYLKDQNDTLIEFLYDLM